jgi:hypothetical protein
MWWILGLNAVPLLFASDDTWIPVALAIAAVYLPAKFMSWMNEEKGG